MLKRALKTPIRMQIMMAALPLINSIALPQDRRKKIAMEINFKLHFFLFLFTHRILSIVQCSIDIEDLNCALAFPFQFPLFNKNEQLLCEVEG